MGLKAFDSGPEVDINPKVLKTEQCFGGIIRIGEKVTC
jgi:hypothetical protein